MQNHTSDNLKGRIDWVTTIIPFLMIVFLCLSFFLFPDTSKHILESTRFFLGDRLGVYYLAIGLGVFLLSFFIAFSKYGDIRLGRPDEKPKYSTFAWSSMMFTSGLRPISCSTPSVNGFSTPKTLISEKWDPCRTGPALIRFSTGGRSHGVFTSCLQSHLALCFM